MSGAGLRSQLGLGPGAGCGREGLGVALEEESEESDAAADDDEEEDEEESGSEEEEEESGSCTAGLGPAFRLRTGAWAGPSAGAC